MELVGPQQEIGNIRVTQKEITQDEQCFNAEQTTDSTLEKGLTKNSPGRKKRFGTKYPAGYLS